MKIFQTASKVAGPPLQERALAEEEAPGFSSTTSSHACSRVARSRSTNPGMTLHLFH